MQILSSPTVWFVLIFCCLQLIFKHGAKHSYTIMAYKDLQKQIVQFIYKKSSKRILIYLNVAILAVNHKSKVSFSTLIIISGNLCVGRSRS